MNKHTQTFNEFTNENFIPAGFGIDSMSTYSLGGTPNIRTGYNMSAIIGPVTELGNCIAKEAYAYEADDDPGHKAESYIKEAKKHIDDKINEACENYSVTNEAMVQIAGKDKPAGAQVLATVLVDYMIKKDFLNQDMNITSMKKSLVEDIKKFIMNNTF
jgi:hypothetical protein